MAHERDTQRTRVYKFDGRVKAESKSNPVMTLPEIEALTTKLAQSYGVRPPRVKDGRRRSRAAADAYHMALPKRTRDMETVLHELAHVFMDNKSYTAAWHGAEFMRVLIDLLAKNKVMDKASLIRIAREEGCKIAPRTKIPQFTGWRETVGQDIKNFIWTRAVRYALTHKQVRDEVVKAASKLEV